MLMDAVAAAAAVVVPATSAAALETEASMFGSWWLCVQRVRAQSPRLLLHAVPTCACCLHVLLHRRTVVYDIVSGVVVH